MKRFMFVVLVCLFLLTPGAFAGTEAWLSTDYSSGFSHSFCRAPVTNGYMDLYLSVDNVNFTKIKFSVVYDSSIVADFYEGNIIDMIEGVSVDVSSVNLEGSWKKATFDVVANSNGGISIGDATYFSDAVMRVRIVPIAEGTVAIGMWDNTSTRYPASYTTCSLEIYNGEDGDGNEIEVEFSPKQFNDEVQLISFTDKTSAGIYHFFDMNFGNALSDGVLHIDYSDGSFEEFSSSDPNKGITINPYFGVFFITAQPDANSYKIIFPGYSDENISISAGQYISCITPSGFLNIENLFFHTLQADSEDTELSVWCPGIGVDFNAGNYNVAIAGWNGGILNRTFGFSYIDNDRIGVTIHGGLDVDNYSLYVYKEGLILGQTFFEAAIYQSVIFDINDVEGNPLSNVEVLLPTYGPMGFATIGKVADANGQVSFDLPGTEWGQFFEYIVTHDDYNDVFGTVEVYDSAVTEEIVMNPALGVDMADYAEFSKWWLSQDCAWNNYCEGADRNYDAKVDYQDLYKLAHLWLKDMQ